MNDYLDTIFQYKDGMSIYGLTKELDVFYLLKYFHKIDNSLIVVTSSLYEANQLANLISTYEDNYLLYPMDDFLTSFLVAESPELKYIRLETIKKIKTGKYIILTNLMGYLKFLPQKGDQDVINITKGMNLKRDDLLEKIINFGYHKESVVTSTGEYAVRGFIIDLFPINMTNPLRIEFEDDVIDSIRSFNEETQLSTEKINSIEINPIEELISKSYTNLVDYANSQHLVFIDYKQIKVSYEKLVNDIFEYQQSKGIKDKLMYSLNEINPKKSLYINTIDNEKVTNGIIYDSSEIINFNQNFALLKDNVNKWLKNKKEVIFCLSKDSQIKKIKELALNVKIVRKKINRGFIIDKYVVIGENDIENIDHQTNFKANFRFGKRIKDFNSLEIGDYIVHPSYGIGIYNGLVNLYKNGISKDYIQLLYAGDDKVYIPVEKINNIYKYGDKDGVAPKINELNSQSWYKTKKNIEGKVKDISKELIELYQERLRIKTKPYQIYPEQEIFKNSFDFPLTSDQIKSYYDILNDLKQSYPMDRLLCGDVGFGKTEMAFEAIFDTILNNKQTMYLCPTTILSNQQYSVALNRFKDWPITIELLNRFVPKSKQDSIIENFKLGKVDLLFGTHRLLSKDVIPKDLGLLVVDEEQRFGVSHKEKIKELTKDVNVLTLSATPIPRTLKMALSGLRDLSIIDTPPNNRYPVQTYIIEENDFVIKDAIYKELSRNGQIFILYNRIENIENMALHIKKLIPDASINFAHGKMDKNKLENTMNSFIKHEFDILICTTIIENGIDIPNVNTLIVYDSDNFGLSQLYQIRGRVGRSNKIGYAYLLYKPQKMLNEIAIKRLNAIKEFTSLGSGYKIAMRDLSIRGAGDIFGSSQAGFIDSVGINYYLKMMDDALKMERGEIIKEDLRKESLLNVETHINDSYVSDNDIKLEIHQKINEVNSYEKFLEIKDELEDRFGKISPQLEVYMYEEWFESLALELNVKKVNQTDRYIEIEITEDIIKNLDMGKITYDILNISENISMREGFNRIYITLYYKNLENHYLYYLIDILDIIKNNFCISK